ncbi:MAG: hypothetical protein AAF490_01665 [Chloroflexota bacterium]
MSDQDLTMFTRDIQSQKETLDLIEKLTDVAQADAGVSQPVSEHGHTAIIVSEVTTSLGAGFGSGGAPENGGHGGGGGGFSMSRPVALIQIGPNGVRQESLFDVTKVGIAMIATIGSIFLAWLRMKKVSNQ